MRKFVLLSTALFVVPCWMQNAEAQCVATQDCASLGYTENSCPNGGIKCPFGNTWACKGESCESENDNPNCTYGAIYYADGICVKEFVSGRVPIGVVVYVDAVTKQKWIMALDNIGSGLYWTASEFDEDVPGVTNYTTERTAVSDLNSCENTEILVAQGEGRYPAAITAKNYVPEGGENTKGKWCLPAAGIWNMVNIHRSEIDKALSLAKGTSLSYMPEYTFGTSTENSMRTAWGWKPDGSFVEELKFYRSSPYGRTLIRPVMKI